MKRRLNRIERLVNDVGVEFEDEVGMKNVVLDYFHQLFCESLDLNEFVTYHMTPCVSAAMNSTLLSPFQDEEFKRAIF
jgi:hypothetical protein